MVFKKIHLREIIKTQLWGEKKKVSKTFIYSSLSNDISYWKLKVFLIANNVAMQSVLSFLPSVGYILIKKFSIPTIQRFFLAIDTNMYILNKTS